MTVARSEVRGRNSNMPNAIEESARITRSTKSGLYTCDIGTVITGTNIAWSSLATGAFTTMNGNVMNFVEIFSPQAVTAKFRTIQNVATLTASLPAIPIRANTLRTIDYIADITEIYFTNASGSTSAVEVTAI